MKAVSLFWKSLRKKAGHQHLLRSLKTETKILLCPKQHVYSPNSTSKALIILIIRLKPLWTQFNCYISACFPGPLQAEKETNMGKRSRSRNREQKRPHEGITHFLFTRSQYLGPTKPLASSWNEPGAPALTIVNSRMGNKKDRLYNLHEDRW